ncbi:NAD/ferredoxin-dependent reductase-like protein [Kribbella amoyensis]|uniref:NAD/ferredoxin-dependent reductase-like protein n=1 Tax=Kribbella amoyensis TaxID=996641 RepID=A0A561BMI6_9ACTN|nr:FAD-dependent oxidoreductase [Kribbella amoyensis]TWD80106.1 NAD/ferredoxin-dependent reductase-like protein [Kribbella amoyensis]
MLRNVVVVGASAAGLSTAEALRAKGYDGKLTLVGEERRLPYDRPPLSKQVLAGVWEPEKVALRDEPAIGKLDADLRLGRRALGLDVSRRELRLDGDRLAYDGLVIATGVSPRRLPGDELAGVYTVRTLDDALALRTALLGGTRVVVIGAGFLGSEVAATARGLNLDVTLVGPQPAPLYRQFGAGIAALVGELHRDHGVRLRMTTGVTRFVADESRVVGVELTDGTVLDADVVVVAIGASPATGWLADSGLTVRDGVECDAQCRAAPGIYAAGDVASWYHPLFDQRMRVEHRLNATEQGMAVAANLLGADRPFAPIPYFWSDQYDVRLQAYGIFPQGAPMTLVHGEIAAGRFVVAAVEDGVVVGVLGWNCPPRDLRELRRLVADRRALPEGARS